MSFVNVQRPNERTATFTLRPLTVTYANTLRRLILTGVETVAFAADMDEKGRTGDVTVEANDTPMTNEMLAHRISLLPISVKDPLSFKPDNYEFHLKVANDSDRTLDVTASHFDVFERSDNPDEEPRRLSTPDFFPANPITGDTCLIAILKSKTFGQAKGQSVALKAKATVGTGKQHARHIPVSQCSYVYTPDTNEERRKEVFDSWLVKSKKVDPTALESDASKKAALMKEFNTMEAARCYLRDETGEPYSYDFTVESAGVLSVNYIIRRACEVGEAMCMRYMNLATGELPEDVTIQPADAQMLGFDFYFAGHDHTLGKLLSTYLVENHYSGAAEPKITFAGSIVPHPLRDIMLLRVGVEDGQEMTAREAVAAAARGCAELFRQLRANWLAATGAGAGPVATIRRSRPATAATAASTQVTVKKQA